MIRGACTSLGKPVTSPRLVGRCSEHTHSDSSAAQSVACRRGLRGRLRHTQKAPSVAAESNRSWSFEAGRCRTRRQSCGGAHDSAARSQDSRFVIARWTIVDKFATKSNTDSCSNNHGSNNSGSSRSFEKYRLVKNQRRTVTSQRAERPESRSTRHTS